MPTGVALVSCVKSKQANAARAKDLYMSPLFRGLRSYAESHADGWYILSAEHGLVRPEQVIEPYDRTLNRMPLADRQHWAEEVRRSLAAVLAPGVEVTVLAGLRYRESIVPFLEARGHAVTVPFAGLALGHQLRRLRELGHLT